MLMHKERDATYDYPAKGTVRRHWIPFAIEQVPAKLRPLLEVWFLPGHEGLEIPEYVARNISMQQLLGFEWNGQRARILREKYPKLRLEVRPLASFLHDETSEIAPHPDWAHLDFDGSAHTFAREIRTVVSRMRFDRAPRLALSSPANRDRTALIRCIETLSAWNAIIPHRFNFGLDLLRECNDDSGLVLDEPSASYTICRELAVSLNLIRSIGERVWYRGDEDSAHGFEREFKVFDQSITHALRGRVEAQLGRPLALPIAHVDPLPEFFAKRLVPVRLTDRLRFMYRSPNDHRRCSWYFRFEKQPTPVSLATWVENLFLTHPPLHVVDFMGEVIGNRRRGVCPHCNGSYTDPNTTTK